MPSWRPGAGLFVGLVLVLVFGAGAATSVGAVAAPSTTLVRQPVVVFDGGLKDGWIDFGWTNKPLVSGRPVEIDVGDFGGWIAAKPGGLAGPFGALELKLRVPDSFAGALAVRLGDDRNSTFPEVIVPAAKADRQGLRSVSLRFDRLNPTGLSFDRIVIRGRVQLPKTSILTIERLSLTPGTGPAQAPSRAGAPLSSGDRRAVSADVDCAADRKPISALIYGTAYDEIHDASSPQQWTMGITARRWGGWTAR